MFVLKKLFGGGGWGKGWSKLVEVTNQFNSLETVKSNTKWRRRTELEGKCHSLSRTVIILEEKSAFLKGIKFRRR